MESMEPIERIVVGVDGSAHAEAALRWALAEAEHHDATVQAVMAWSYLDQANADSGERFDADFGEDDARAALRASVAKVDPSRPLEERVVLDLPGRALIEAGDDADLLVVGTRGLGGFKGLLLGSVSERVLEHAPCPVAIVRKSGNPSAGGSVVVGIDGSETSTTALRWAAREAAARKAPLEVVHAWQIPPVDVPTTEQIMGAVEHAARGVLDEALADPALVGLDVEGHMPYQGATQAMLARAGDAALIVVGSRGLGRFGRVLLGSTSRQLAHHAPCPVLVIPPVQGR